MQTNLPQALLLTPEGREADRILRSCVHCGFCNATCPTYQLLGDELDGPRGRIYQIKNVLEGGRAGAETQLHLDRCLSCQACETTCPSGVEYHKLLNIGRAVVDSRVARPPSRRWLRWLLGAVLPRRRLFTPLLRAGQLFRPLLPAGLKNKVPRREKSGPLPQTRHRQKIILAGGCVQAGLAPGINIAAARVLDRLGIETLQVREESCCGALNYHLDSQDRGIALARRNIDAWWPYIENHGATAIASSASGCGAFIKQYAELLAHEPDYADKARRVSALCKDISEIVSAAPRLQALRAKTGTKVAFHSPCTLQHGQKITGLVEGLLQQLGFQLTAVRDSHLCCGSAGTYSILQADLSARLRADKVAALTAEQPDLIATANIGCLMHLRTSTDTTVRHWIEVVAEGMV